SNVPGSGLEPKVVEVEAGVRPGAPRAEIIGESDGRDGVEAGGVHAAQRLLVAHRGRDAEATQAASTRLLDDLLKQVLADARPRHALGDDDRIHLAGPTIEHQPDEAGDAALHLSHPHPRQVELGQVLLETGTSITVVRRLAVEAVTMRSE